MKAVEPDDAFEVQDGISTFILAELEATQAQVLAISLAFWRASACLGREIFLVAWSGVCIGVSACRQRSLVYG